MAVHWFIGCSSYYNFRWKEVFYPADLPSGKWFEYYATRFNTFELNATFYKTPRLKTLQKLYDTTPDGFRFSAKAPKAVTHVNPFNGARSLVENFYGLVKEGFKDKLGCVLFQLPPRLSFSMELLDRIIENTDPAVTNAVEFRNATWWDSIVFNKLTAHGITFCGVSYPKLPDNVIINSQVNYYRLHGVPKLYYEQYDELFLENIGSAISKSPDVTEAYVYFNNTASVAAIHNAMYMKELLKA